eukprot:5053654-Alexandrium_andersonii.AAC.1
MHFLQRNHLRALPGRQLKGSGPVRLPAANVEESKPQSALPKNRTLAPGNCGTGRGARHSLAVDTCVVRMPGLKARAFGGARVGRARSLHPRTAPQEAETLTLAPR